MKVDLIWLVLFLTFTGHSMAQSDEGIRLFKAGDTVFVAEDRLPENPRLYRANASGFWNFRNLQAPYSKQLKVSENRDASIAGNIELSGLDNVRYILQEEGGDLWITGMKLKLDGQPVSGRSDPAIPYRINGVSPGDSKEFSGTVVFEYPLDLVAALPDKNLAFADSLRSIVEWTVSIESDQKGELELESGLFKTLRQSVQTKSDVHHEAKRNGEWQVVQTDLGLKLPSPLTNGLSYHFWSADMVEPLAIVFVDDQGDATNVRFRASEYSSRRVVEEAPDYPDIIAHPNPTFGFVRFDLSNLSPGQYFIEVYNIIGVKLKSFPVQVDRQLTFPQDLSDLRRGTYIYRLVDFDQKTIRSKRLVIITP